MWQLASTMGFVLNKNNGSFMKNMTPDELAALHPGQKDRSFFVTFGPERDRKRTPSHPLLSL